MTSNQTIKHYPLSSPQREIWFDQILHPDVPLYNIGGYVRIDGPIDPALFEKTKKGPKKAKKGPGSNYFKHISA